MKKLIPIVAMFSVLSLLTGCADDALVDESEKTTEQTAEQTTEQNDGKTLIKSERLPYGVRYDSSKWKISNDRNNEASDVEFIHQDGDVYAMVIAERLQMTYQSLKDLFLSNLQEIDPNAKMTKEEDIKVNNLDIKSADIEAVISGMQARYKAHFYLGEEGTIQFVAFTSANLADEYADDMVELLNGLEIYKGQKIEKTSSAAKDFVTIKGAKVGYSIKYDKNKWTVEESEEDDGTEYSFTHVDGDVYGKIIPERIEMDIEALIDTALENLRALSSDAKVVSSEEKKVNGTKMRALKMDGTLAGIVFEYYGYYYAGDAGSIQFVVYSGKNLSEDYKDDIQELLDGFEVD